MIRLTIDMPRWLWWLALRLGLAITLEVEGERLSPFDLVQHGRPLSLLYRAGEDWTAAGGHRESRSGPVQPAERETMALARLR